MNVRIADYYDDRVPFQERRAHNERHLHLFTRMLTRGLRRDSVVIELGCGIGAITSQVLRVVTTGRVIAVDISPRSIEVARERNRGPVAEFHIADITEFEPAVRNADFVTLFDVLEHIPVSAHPEVLSRAHAWLRPMGDLMVNIPNPEYIRFLHENRPEELQAVDQALDLGVLIHDAEEAGLVVREVVTYDLWHRDEAVFLRFQPRAAFEEAVAEPPRFTFGQRLRHRLRLYR